LTHSAVATPYRRRIAARRDKKVAAERHGRLAEHLAVVALLLRGYRILARRHLSAAGEIDIVAVRGRRVTFVEVKQRASWDEADIAVRARQTARLHRSADQWVAERPYYREHERGFDSLLVVPWSWPAYRRDALQPN
jgi:putative endonuclease